MAEVSISIFSQFLPAFTSIEDTAVEEPSARKQLKRPTFQQDTVLKSLKAANESIRERQAEYRNKQRAEWIRSKWPAAKREFYAALEKLRPDIHNIRDQAISHKNSAVQMFPMWDEETDVFFKEYCTAVDKVTQKHIDLVGKHPIAKIKISFTTNLTELMKRVCMPAVMRQMFLG